jgi:hypothetical protein
MPLPCVEVPLLHAGDSCEGGPTRDSAIAIALCNLAPIAPQTAIDEVAQLILRIAKALQDAAIKSMHQ